MCAQVFVSRAASCGLFHLHCCSPGGSRGIFQRLAGCRGGGRGWTRMGRWQNSEPQVQSRDMQASGPAGFTGTGRSPRLPSARLSLPVPAGLGLEILLFSSLCPSQRRSGAATALQLSCSVSTNALHCHKNHPGDPSPESLAITINDLHMGSVMSL